MSELKDRESQKAAQAKTSGNAQTLRRFDVPVVVDEKKCITGCRVCIEACPVDCLGVNLDTQKAAMLHDECWYCLACEIDCPKDAITVKIPFLLR